MGKRCTVVHLLISILTFRQKALDIPGKNSQIQPVEFAHPKNSK
jgi:hypothetical protein